MNKDLETARMLVQIGNEVTITASNLTAMMVEMMRLSQALSSIQARLQAATHLVLNEPPPSRFEENTSFGVAENPQNPDGAASPVMAPQAHDDRETVTASPAGEVGAGKGLDAQAPGTAPPQSEQVVQGDAPVQPGASLEAPVAEVYNSVLDRFAATGHGHNELATVFAVRVSVISQCLAFARATQDRRVAMGDLKRSELVDGKEPDPKAAAPAPKPSRVKKAAETKGTSPALEPIATIAPEPDAIGNPLVTVSFTDGVAVRGDTSQDVRMGGPLLRIVSYLKDQRWYELEDVMRAARYGSEAVFRANLIDLQRAIGQIGLHIVEDAGKGFQLRRMASVPGSAKAA